MLSAGFATFAEAQLPNRILGTCHIDVLALAPTGTWFVVGEFKKLFRADNLASLLNDIERLNSFRPRSSYSASHYGPQFEAAAARCVHGYGIIGGLHAAKNGNSDTLEAWTTPNLCSSGSVYEKFAKRMEALRAILPAPLHVCDFPTGYRYYLLGAVFPIALSESRTPEAN